MSSPDAFTAFENRLAAWTTTPVVFENQFHEPDDPFIYVEVYGDTYDQDTTGAPEENAWYETGATLIHVMVASGGGSGLARDYAKSLMYLFREQDIGAGINITEMSIGAGEPGRDFPNFWAMTLSIFWRRFDITSIPTP
jgi:hypothetical protein